ncbi:MAG TPA: tetratricopeptide repeat protein [Acidobacteriota bacterium]|nr:tetratricopeptide repeat protein [Acidobacteriota bacterium]
MKAKGIAAVLVLMLAPLFFGALQAQSGIIKGKVMDSEGNGIPDAEVRIQGMDVNREYKIKTNDKGEFIHIGVNLQGIYRIIATKEGYTGGFVQGVRPKLDRGGEGVEITMDKGAQRQMSFDMTEEEIARIKEEREKAKERAEKLSNAFQGGIDAFNAGDYESAKEQFLVAAESAPDEPNVWGNLGQTHARLEEYEEAVKAYEKAIALKPGEATFHQNLGGVYARMGQSDKAKAQYEKAAGLAAASDPTAAADSYYNMAVGFINSGQNAEAAEALQQAIQHNPDHPQANYQLGLVLLNLGKMDECKQYLKKYIELEPDSPDAATAKAILESLG